MSANIHSAEPATAFLESVHCARLQGLRVIQLSGADALSFLHGQLTQDVQGLAPDGARLAAYCSAKGRMLASLVMWRVQLEDGGTAVRALVDAGIVDSLVKRLRMFVLRAKVTIEDLGFDVSGVWADTEAARDALDAWAGGLPTEAWQLVDGSNGVWIAAPRGVAAPAGRWWHISTQAQDLPLDSDADEQTWRQQDILAGLPWVTQPLQDLVMPLVANFDLIGGVSFTKGCYPGQEIVARTHYLGKQKRRTLLGQVVSGATPAAPDMVGKDVHQAQSGGEPLGRVINAASGATGTYVLFEAPVAVALKADLRLGGPDGPEIAVQPLPYSIVTES